MAPNSTTIANGVAAATKGPSPGRLSSIYSEVQTNRLHHDLPLPSILKSPFKIVDGPSSSAAGNPGSSPFISLKISDFSSYLADEIAILFPNLFGQPSTMLVPAGSVPSEMTGSLSAGGDVFIINVDHNPDIPKDTAIVGKQIFTALQCFLSSNPDFKSRPVYLAGFNYAGVHRSGIWVLHRHPQ